MDRLLDDNVMPSNAAIVAFFLKTRACAGRKEYLGTYHDRWSSRWRATGAAR